VRGGAVTIDADLFRILLVFAIVGVGYALGEAFR
jgi:hypothetical protein